DNLKRITGATLAALINGVYNHRYVIADCRFDYEFKAGHIAGAVHVGSHDDIETLFFNDPLAVMDGDTQPVVLVVHCEYSMIRGPTRAQQIRALDRQLHADRYPYLRYTEVYVLDGGFVNFYKSYRGLC
ncbi:Rhodanese-like protein, partial [Ramicandelaber brevisporus]